MAISLLRTLLVVWLIMFEDSECWMMLNMVNVHPHIIIKDDEAGWLLGGNTLYYTADCCSSLLTCWQLPSYYYYYFYHLSWLILIKKLTTASSMCKYSLSISHSLHSSSSCTRIRSGSSTLSSILSGIICNSNSNSLVLVNNKNMNNSWKW